MTKKRSFALLVAAMSTIRKYPANVCRPSRFPFVAHARSAANLEILASVMTALRVPTVSTQVDRFPNAIWTARMAAFVRWSL